MSFGQMGACRRGEFTAMELAHIFNRAVGFTVRRMREMKAISQGELSRRTNTQWSFISSLERGGLEVDTWMLSRIVPAIGCTTEEFLCELATHVPLQLDLARRTKAAAR